jgi:DNA topoisomerase III
MQEISEMTRNIIQKTKSFEHNTIPGNFGELKTPCPKCGNTIHETYRSYKCDGCDFSIRKSIALRQFEQEEVEELLSKSCIGPLSGFRSKKGKSFSAYVKLTDDYQLKLDFSNQKSSTKLPEEDVDFSDQEPIGKCPKCGASIYEYDQLYVCENAIGKNRTCNFRSGKIILKQPISREQMHKLLAEKKSDLFTKFISKRGRPFRAYLIIKSDGSTGFEFPDKIGRKKNT